MLRISVIHSLLSTEWSIVSLQWIGKKLLDVVNFSFIKSLEYGDFCYSCFSLNNE